MRDMELLRFFTAGSVDDGKSTLIGRLLLDTKFILDDQLQGIQDEQNDYALNLASITDGLRAEREQGITIDVAYRYFHTEKRKFIIADAPGHAQYTRNMVTAASSCSAALLLIDVTQGLTQQSVLHLRIISLLQIPNLIVCINKMDIVDFSQTAFDTLSEEMKKMMTDMDFEKTWFVPTSALLGDNIVNPSSRINWYDGDSVLKILEEVTHISKSNATTFFPIQYVSSFNQNGKIERLLFGECLLGGIGPGQQVQLFPSGKSTRVNKFFSDFSEVDALHSGMYAALVLEDPLDVERGELLVSGNHTIICTDIFECTVCWLDDAHADFTQTYILRIGGAERKIHFLSWDYKLDVQTGNWLEDAETLNMNEISKISIQLSSPLYKIPYVENKQLGSAILVDTLSGKTVAALIIES